MNVLILGATGFIGNAIFNALVSEHNVVIAGRRPVEGYDNWREVDFLKHNDWGKLLDGMELVINAVGIIEGDFKKIHASAPVELYTHCIDRGIKIIHISAIGAEKEEPQTDFLRSKKVTDSFLLKYDKAKVVYPGIVIGRKGKSTRFFTEMAHLPVIPLMSEKPMPFVHITQLAQLVKTIIQKFDRYPCQVFAVSEPEPLRDIFSALRGSKGRFIKVPEVILRVFFVLFPSASIGIFNRATFKMYQSSSVDDYQPLFPKVSTLIDSKNVEKGETLPELFALLALSFIWICSGVCSLISWDESYRLMKEIGANHQLSVLSIWLGSLVDIFLGIAIFIKKYRKSIIVLQVVIILTYMLILSIGAPHFWLHPFGVLTKNIPLLALSYYLYRKQK